MTRVVPALALAALVGCANQSAPATAAPAAPKRVQQLPEPTVRLESPVKVRWEEVERTATAAVVVAHVERVNAVPVPLLLRVEVPAGVEVKRGTLELRLAPNPEAGTMSERYELAFTAPPAGDLVLRVDGDTDAMGFHFQVPYRFGRPAPEAPGPAATGPAFQKGGKNFGPSIPLGDAPQPTR